MALDETRIASDIVANVQRVAAAAPQGTAAAAAPNLSGDFCSIWPQAKPVLEFLAGVAIFVPGAGTTAGAVLQGLIKVGDQVSSQVCK